MEKVEKEGFSVIGIRIKTTNKDEQSAKDIGRLWEQFMSEQIAGKIPNRIDTSILSIYTNYEGDHLQPYDTILGCRVSSLEDIPVGMIGQDFAKSDYVQFHAKGDLTKIIYNTWLEIWEQNLDRTYTADFEEYDEKAQDPTNAAVDIFVAVK